MAPKLGLFRLLGSTLLLVTVACGSATAAPTRTPTNVPQSTKVATILPQSVTATLAATATRPVPPAAPTTLPTPSQPVALTFNAPDGAALAAKYYPPIVRPAPAILLLHMLGGSKADWDSFARDLQKQGYAALAMDLRGQGNSNQVPADWAKAPDDVKGAYLLLTSRPEVDPNRTAIVGASVGANLALMVGGGQSRVEAVVALSPGVDFLGLNPSSAMRNFGERPVLLVASQDDAYSYSSIQTLAALSISAEKLQLTKAGHGTAMFADPTLEPALLAWLNKIVRDLK
jgi:dienelactone hydrolase